MDTLPRAGVRFRNTWVMPECTPSRALFFEGRYPLRTNILNVVTGFTLANSQVSPFETTTPKLLKEVGYDSAPFGKFHLAGHAGARRRRRLAFCRRVVIEAYRRTPSGERYG